MEGEQKLAYIGHVAQHSKGFLENLSPISWRMANTGHVAKHSKSFLSVGIYWKISLRSAGG